MLLKILNFILNKQEKYYAYNMYLKFNIVKHKVQIDSESFYRYKMEMCNFNPNDLDGLYKKHFLSGETKKEVAIIQDNVDCIFCAPNSVILKICEVYISDEKSYYYSPEEFDIGFAKAKHFLEKTLIDNKNILQKFA